MNITELRALIKGNKATISRITATIDASDAEMDLDEVQNVLETLLKKQTMIEGLHGQVLDALPTDNDEEVEELQEEVIIQNEYSHQLDCSINKLKKTLKVKTSNLNTTADSFNQSSNDQGNMRENASGTDKTNSNVNSVLMDNSCFNVQNSSSINCSIYHRLPKLDLPVFTGNALDWQAFWDSYDSAIHGNISLTDVQKFNYLKSLLRGEALQTIAGFALTHANYQKAVDILQERYGKREKIIQTYMAALLDLPAPMNTFLACANFMMKQRRTSGV